MSIPANLFYTKDHEWISIEGDVATVGITNHAQEHLGDIVFVEVPSVGRSLSAHAVFGTVESVKSVNDLFLPMAGTIIEKNPEVDTDPALVNNDPYGSGWIIRVKIEADASREGLLDHEAYAAYIGE